MVPRKSTDEEGSYKWSHPQKLELHFMSPFLTLGAKEGTAFYDAFAFLDFSAK